MAIVNTMTEAQTRAVGADARRLLERAMLQLTEHKEHLMRGLVALEPSVYDLTPSGLTDMLLHVQRIELVLVQPEPGMKEANAATVSVVYDYPDELYAFLARADVPESLKSSLTGGTVLEDRAAVTRA